MNKQVTSFDSSMFSVLFRNFSIAGEKMRRPGLAAGFLAIATSLRALGTRGGKAVALETLLSEIQTSLKDDTGDRIPAAKTDVESPANRGVLRALTWGGKVAAIQNSAIGRFLKSPDTFLEDNKRIYVCDACGFIFAGDSVPDICPVCKAPSSRFSEFK